MFDFKNQNIGESKIKSDPTLQSWAWMTEKEYTAYLIINY